MSHLRAEYKVPGGKLIRIECELDGKRIGMIKISGDFFLHPEEGLDDLEKRLVGTLLEEKSVSRIIETFFSEGFTTVGAKPSDFLNAIMRAAARQ